MGSFVENPIFTRPSIERLEIMYTHPFTAPDLGLGAELGPPVAWLAVESMERATSAMPVRRKMRRCRIRSLRLVVDVICCLPTFRILSGISGKNNHICPPQGDRYGQ